MSAPTPEKRRCCSDGPDGYCVDCPDATAVPDVWRGDHTALVHVLWEAKHQGLSLDDADELATLIRRSDYQRAVQELAAAGRPPVVFDPAAPYRND